MKKTLFLSFLYFNSLLIAQNLIPNVGVNIKAHSAFVVNGILPNLPVQILLGNKQIFLYADSHNPNPSISDIFYTDTAVRLTPLTYSNNLSLQVKTIPKLNLNLSNPIQNRALCDSPFIVSQSIWRLGLPNPKKGRVKTPTKHCIVHHSAGSNTDTNYVQLVRSIYTFHTTGNGWDDIGYNYLIDPNGTIYAGRQPDSLGMDQDNVQGAHFCGKNENTMAICLLGNFETAQPTQLQLNALVKLGQWKVKKDQLRPLLYSPHPTFNGNLLQVFAGHKDGCNTTCPGTNLYAKLINIREQVNLCNKFASVNKFSKINFSQNHNQLFVNSSPVTWEIFDLQGKLITKEFATKIIIQKSNWYFVLINNGLEKKSFTIFIP